MRGDERAILLFSKQLNQHSYGSSHPLKVERLQLTMDLIRAYGLFDKAEAPWVEAQEAEEQDLLLTHSQKYIEILQEANERKRTLTS